MPVLHTGSAVNEEGPAVRKAMVVMVGIIAGLGLVVGSSQSEAVVDSCSLSGSYSLSALGEAGGFIELMGIVDFTPNVAPFATPGAECHSGAFTGNLTLKRQGGAGAPIVVTGTYAVNADESFSLTVPGVIGLTGLLSQVADNIANAFNFVARFEQEEPIALAGSAFRRSLSGVASEVQIVSNETSINNVASVKFISVSCPQTSPGIKVLGGGAAVTGFPANVRLNQSSPTLPGESGWSAQAEKFDVVGFPGAWGLRVFAICARVQ